VSRIRDAFDRAAGAGEKTLITYLMAGHPTLKETERRVIEMAEGGADIIELGVPFTDPLADGPAIQKAAARAVTEGVTLAKVLRLVGRIRKKSEVPIVLMGYYNPIFKYGEERFARDAVRAGVDGVIVPDLIPDEADAFIRAARSEGLDTIFLLAPTSTPDRIRKVTRASSGFLYYVSITGITGAKLRFGREMGEKIQQIKNIRPIPVAVGFGVATPEDARRVGRNADGVIVGSALVKLIEAGRSTRPLVRSLKAALR